MTNLERIKLELGTILPSDDELSIRLAEVGLTGTADYTPTSKLNKRQIYETTLSVLNATANDTKLMNNYREEDQSITGFQQNIRNRITQLENTIRQMDVTDTTIPDNGNENMFMLFRGE